MHAPPVTDPGRWSPQARTRLCTWAEAKFIDTRCVLCSSRHETMRLGYKRLQTRRRATAATQEHAMTKGTEKPGKNNKPKLTQKEKDEKKKAKREKAG